MVFELFFEEIRRVEFYVDVQDTLFIELYNTPELVKFLLQTCKVHHI